MGFILPQHLADRCAAWPEPSWLGSPSSTPWPACGSPFQYAIAGRGIEKPIVEIYSVLGYKVWGLACALIEFPLAGFICWIYLVAWVSGCRVQGSMFRDAYYGVSGSWREASGFGDLSASRVLRLSLEASGILGLPFGFKCSAVGAGLWLVPGFYTQGWL